MPLDQIIIRARGGHDRVRITQSAFGAPAIVRAGTGADEIVLAGEALGFPAVVSGDAGPDHIRLTGTSSSDEFPFHHAHWPDPVLIRAGGGDDQIVLNSVPDPYFPVAGMRIFGDAGNDRILS